MRIEAERKLFTADDFFKMDEAGIFAPDESVELIEGEIIQMRNPGRKHVACCDRATAFFTEAFGRRAIVSIQNWIVLDDYNVPKPDVVVLKPSPDFYASKDRIPEDAFLIVEISLSSFAFDSGVKLRHYAQAGVIEVWIEDLLNDLLLVHRDPAGEVYATCLTLRRGDMISPLAFPDITFKVDDLLGS
jgi:Uma2 family endonuclease